MKIAYGQALEIVLRKPLGEGHETILSLAIDSGDNKIQIRDITRVTGWDRISVLKTLKELEMVSIVRSEVMIHTKWYTSEEA